MNKNKLLVIAGIAALILSFLLGLSLQQTPEIIPATDTVTVTKWERDTFRIDSIVPKYIETIKTVHDTLLTRDSIPVEVEIPIQLAYFDTTVVKYQDTLQIKQTIEGYKPRLLSMETIVNRREKETIITNTLTKNKRFIDRFHLQPQVTSGYDLINKRWGIVIGIGFGYDI